MQQPEVSQLREEVERLVHQVELIKEAYSIRKELESIQSNLQQLKSQSKSVPTSTSTSTSTPAPTPKPIVTPAPSAASAPAPKPSTPTPTPKPVSTPAPTPSTNGASSSSAFNASSNKIGGVGTDIKNTVLPSSMYSPEESQAILAAKNKVVEKPQFQNFGIDADLAQKNAAKYDAGLENETREWIQNVTGETLSGSFASSLKSGVTLCNLVNKLKPNSVKKINKMSAPFMQMENINNFLAAIQSLGVPQSDSFMTVDLYEEKNMNQVITALNSLGRLSRNIEGYSGPSLGPKLSTKHETNFTEEQLRRGQNTLSFAQQSQKESGKMSAEMLKSGTDSVIRSKETGTTTSSLGLLDAGKAEAQKEANNAKREGHNIIR